MERQLAEIQHLATKYSKAELGRMVQMGLLDPQKAMMAGMMIQRIEMQNAQPPQTTVAQDLFGLPAVANQAPQAQAPQMQVQPNPGIEALPTGEVGNYAGGGIVAFADRGLVEEGDQVYYGLPFGGVSGSEEYWARPTMPYGEQMRNLGSSLWQGVKNVFSLPETETKPVTKEKPKAKEDESAAETARLKRQAGEPTPWIDVAGKKAGEPLPPIATPSTAPSTGVKTPAAPRPKFDPNAVKIQGAEMPAYEARDRAAIATARKQAETAEGVDPEMYNKLISDIEGRKGELEKRKGQSAGEAIMMAGLGLLGARRGQEFQTLSESGIKALGAYKQDVKDLRAAEEKYNERIEALRMSDQEAKRTGARADVAQAEKDRDMAYAAKVEKAKAQNELAKTGAQVSAQVYGAELSAQTHRDVAQIHAGAQREYNAALKAQGLEIQKAKIMTDAMGDFMARNKDNPAYMKDPAKLTQDAMAYANSVGVQLGIIPKGANMAPPTAPFDPRRAAQKYGIDIPGAGG